MTDLNKGSEVNLRFEQDDGAVWVFDGDSHQGTEISPLMMMHSDEYNEDELRVICNHAACEIDRLRAELEKAKAQAVPDTKPIAYKVSFDSWQRQHGKDYFEFWKPDEFEDYKPDYLIPLYSFPTISSDFVVVPKEPTQKMLNAAHCYMNPVKGSDVHPETNRKRREMYKAMVKASESGAEG